MQHISLFYTYAAGDAPDGYCGSMAGFSASTYYQAFKHLDTLFATFTDLLVNTHVITASHIDNMRLGVFSFDFLDN